MKLQPDALGPRQDEEPGVVAESPQQEYAQQETSDWASAWGGGWGGDSWGAPVREKEVWKEDAKNCTASGARGELGISSYCACRVEGGLQATQVGKATDSCVWPSSFQ